MPEPKHKYGMIRVSRIHVRMSYVQFTELIIAMNRPSGVPCTIEQREQNVRA
jgi:hypothetical protein